MNPGDLFKVKAIDKATDVFIAVHNVGWKHYGCEKYLFVLLERTETKLTVLISDGQKGDMYVPEDRILLIC